MEREDVLVYRLGGNVRELGAAETDGDGDVDGDWCFVRLPPGYDPNGAPHPLLVCNHGNGWRMDGTERMANFSAKTQYGVDPQNNGRYLDSGARGFRRYSNPSIESFLAKGYVVCGAQNGGDGLFGNERCASACAALYRHMQACYNVSESAFMLGVSNGFMTTLNAIERVGPRAIAAIVGLYPLCNLADAFAYSHRQAVKRAYAIESDDDPEAYLVKAASFDPCGPAWSGDRIPAEAFPPTLLIWSGTDRVLPMKRHAAVLARKLRARGICVEDIRIDAEAREGKDECPHGDWRHFREADIVGWCERFKLERGIRR